MPLPFYSSDYHADPHYYECDRKHKDKKHEAKGIWIGNNYDSYHNTKDTNT